MATKNTYENHPPVRHVYKLSSDSNCKIQLGDSTIGAHTAALDDVWTLE